MCIHTKFFSRRVILIAIVATMICLISCVQQFQVPEAEKNVIKAYQRMIIYAHHIPWTKSNIDIREGDQILITASGKATTWPGHEMNLAPYRRLTMKISKTGFPIGAVARNNQLLYRSIEEGRLMFSVRDWERLDSEGRPVWDRWCQAARCYYADNTGKYFVDIFVFSDASEDEIVQALKARAEANPNDKHLIATIDQVLSEVNRYKIVAIASQKASKEIDETKKMIETLKKESKIKKLASEKNKNEPKNQLLTDDKDKRILELEQKLEQLSETLKGLEELKTELEQGREKISILSLELKEKEKYLGSGYGYR